MKKFFALSLFVGIILASTMSFAQDMWAGKITVNGNQWDQQTPIKVNIAAESQTTFTYEYYQQNLNINDPNVWQKVDAEVNVRKNGVHFSPVVASGYAQIIGHSGNNLVYQFNLNNIHPCTTTTSCMDPALLNGGTMYTTITLGNGGAVLATIPVQFTYIP